MKKSLVFAFLNIVFLNPIIIKGRCNQDPYTICQSSRRKKIVATSLNLPKLISTLKNNNVPNAYVFGWNDHDGLYVLHQNGSLAPYDQYTNVSEYAFCEGDCPCPENNIVTPYSDQKKTKEWFDSVSKCKPQAPWVSQSSISHNTNALLPCSSSESQRCVVIQKPREINLVSYQKNTNDHCLVPHERKYQKYDQHLPYQQNSHQYSFNACESNPSTSYCKFENKCCPFFQKVKTEQCQLKECQGNSVCTKIQNKNHKSYSVSCINDCTNRIITKDKNDALVTKVYNVDSPSSCTKYNIPSILHNNKLLHHVKRSLECKFKSKVCLYVTDNSSLYAYIDGCLYKICFTSSTNDKKFYTESVNKQEIQRLTAAGLYNITFE